MTATFERDCYLLFWYAFLVLFLLSILAMQNCRLLISSAHGVCHATVFINVHHDVLVAFSWYCLFVAAFVLFIGIQYSSSGSRLIRALGLFCRNRQFIFSTFQ